MYGRTPYELNISEENCMKAVAYSMESVFIEHKSVTGSGMLRVTYNKQNAVGLEKDIYLSRKWNEL